MAKNNKIGVEPITTSTLIITTLVTQALKYLPLLFQKSARQEEIFSINEESVILKPIAYKILESYPEFRAYYQPIIDRIWEDTDRKKGKNKNAGESAINCVYREIILNASSFVPELQNLNFLPRNIWSCTPQIQSNLQKTQQNINPLAPQSSFQNPNSLEFKPNFVFLIILGVLAILFFSNKDFFKTLKF